MILSLGMKFRCQGMILGYSKDKVSFPQILETNYPRKPSVDTRMSFDARLVDRYPSIGRDFQSIMVLAICLGK